MDSDKDPLRYNVQTLREAAGLDTEDEDTPVANYECQSCGFYTYIDDHQRYTPSYCHSCKEIKTFQKIE